MQPVVHLLHHVDPKLLEFLEHALLTSAGLVGSVVLLGLVLKCCGKR